MSLAYWDVAVPFYEGDVAKIKRLLKSRPESVRDDRTTSVTGRDALAMPIPRFVSFMLHDLLVAQRPQEHPHFAPFVKRLLELDPAPERWGDCLRAMIDAYRGHLDLRAAHPLVEQAPEATPTSMILGCAKSGNEGLLSAATEGLFGVHDPHEIQKMVEELDEGMALRVLQHPNLRISSHRREHRFEEAACSVIAKGYSKVLALLQAKGLDLSRPMLRSVFIDREYRSRVGLVPGSEREVRTWAYPFHMVRSTASAREVLALGADPHAKGVGVAGGGSGLMDAIAHGDMDLLRWFVQEQGADLEQRDDDGNTPLLYACLQGGVKQVQYLLSRGANMWVQNLKGEGAVLCGVRGAGSGSTKKLRIFLDAGMTLDAADASGAYIGDRVRSEAQRQFVVREVEAAARAGKPFDQGFIQDLVDHLALRHDAVGLYRILACGAFDGKAVQSGKTNLLHRLAQCLVRGDLTPFDANHSGRAAECVLAEKVVAAGLPVDLRNERGYTALMEAALCKRIDLAHVLMDLGADPEAQTPSGRKAVNVSRREVVRRALRSGEMARKIEHVLSDEQGSPEQGTQPSDYAMKGVL